MSYSLNQRVRVGAVSYLNSKPLLEGLDDLKPELELLLDYPSRLADSLAGGSLDVALIPSVECFRGPGYEIVSDACVATHGSVMSVKLYCRVPFGEIRTLALDAGSRTSAALVQVMLAERYGVDPQTTTLALGCSVDATDADAILLIGDRAMRPLEESFVGIWDLGEEWLKWTGLPFVFAMWASRSRNVPDSIEETLQQTRDRGVRNIKQIARREATLLGLSERTAYKYLSENLHYRLGSAERKSLMLFNELAAQCGLVPKGVELVFRNCSFA